MRLTINIDYEPQQARGFGDVADLNEIVVARMTKRAQSGMKTMQAMMLAGIDGKKPG